LVVDRAAADRRRICEAGRQAGIQSQWIEAADSTTAARMMESREIDFVVADSLILGDSLAWLRRGMAATSHPANALFRRNVRGPVVVILSDDQQPLRIQQMLDAGADCLLSKRLPQSLLESELRELVAQSAKRLADPVQSPITFPNGSHS
jgi:DNA-binding NarL/FixJ family response regulator